MAALEKATLVRLKADPAAQPDEDGAPVPVQFNPASMRMSHKNGVSDGDTRGLQARQLTGKSSTELSFDLHFDTADEAGPSAAGFRSVREKTALVEQFVVPARDPADAANRVVPPRVRFQWGDLKLDGIVEALTIDFDLFAPDGTPLRAKMGVTIKEQDLKYEIGQQSQGQGAPAPVPGAKGAGAPGSVGGGLGLSVGGGLGFSAGGGLGFSAGGGVALGLDAHAGVALGGESVADFSARMGLDPAAWRAAAGGLEGTLSLEAGAEISFGVGASVSLGLGATGGLLAGANADLDVSFGLSASAGSSAGAGFALSASGGLGAALESVSIVRAAAADADARRAFGAPPSAPMPSTSSSAGTLPAVGISSLPATTAALATLPTGDPARLPVRPAMPEQPRAPLARTGFPSRSAQLSTPAAPSRPRADGRATTYGFGVPLRPRRGGATALRTAAISGGIALRPRVDSSRPPLTRDPTAPPWEQLPAADADRAAATAAGHCGCGCGDRRHGGLR